ncbi:unnamed protein product [Pieris macdunnoughi]|uniref:C2HC/C3H-type domain-containing protein n=1 Tax=Pieris macdunnoughi TaxID=345717 RepID=A0A821U0E0_9NEOP|nr:unnamed protein product [Pieris macdunnoughi]
MVGLLNYFTCGFINRERGFRRVPSLSDLEVGLAGAQQRLLTRFKADGFSKRHHEQHNSIKSSRSGSPEPSDGPSSVESFRPIQRTPTPSRLGPPPSPPVPTKPVAPAAPEPSGPLMPCAICGRTFVPQSLSKHVKICEKMTVKKRKTFDSSRQRREGTDLEQYLPKNFGLPENSPFLEKSPPNTAKATPKPKPQSVRTAIMKPTADLQKCPHCGRAFGVRAFERHVDWCADKAKILPAASAQAPPHITDAKQRLNARTQYKAPPVRTRRSSQTREKSSRSASVESSRGVSPPREFGDYKHPQSRASESGSSNDYHEESSPHIPVIRNSRSSQNKSSGDANIKARQARLAKDLSSTRNNEEPIALQSKTDPINKQHDQKKPRLNVRKKQQLKNLEEIAEKHKARSEKIIADQKRIKEKIAASKSQIPIRNQQKTQITNCDDILKQELNTEEEEVSVAKLKPKSNYSKKKSISSKSRRQKDNTVKKETVKKLKESTMSLDSLEDCPPKSDREQRSQSIGINTELLCPCVPCVIHDTSSDKTKSKNRSSSTTNKTRVDKTDELLENTITVPSPSVELLFKNLTMVSSCDISTDLREQNDHDDIVHNLSENSIPNYPTESKELCKNPAYEGEIFEENYERDLSEDSFECDNKKEIEIKEDENETNLISRHGSGDTYTKFMDNPADLEEFLTLTDNMMTCETKCQEEFSKNIEDLHTPKTNSIESICLKNNDNITMKHNFSESFEELKNNFKDLLQEAQEFPPSNSEETRKVSDLEHITVYELKLYEQEENTKDVPIEPDKKIKLPSIAENNKGPQKGKNNIASIYKDNRKVKMQKRTDKDYQTYIIKERRDESSDEAPPLKLPRIELKRLDDNYDPFACAARQMKELMSSDTNIPKKQQKASKESSRTLPSLKPTPTRASTLNRTDNTKTIKDTINKTYQKTPTLNRMKSFGSTHNDNLSSSFGGRCSSFRLNRNEKKPTLNTTFTKSSKENINSVEKPYFNRSSNLNRSFSSYNNSVYSTPKLKNKIPKLSTSMHHAFQRNTGSQPLKLEKIKKDDKKDLVNLDAILSCDNSSMTDSNYIDPMLINENDNLPINVNTILNNPDIISSFESLLTTENLPAKFESFSTIKKNNNCRNITNIESLKNEKNNNFHSETSTTPIISDLGAQYDKLMYSLDHSITSRTSGRDDDSLCEDFDLEEFMTSFDEEVNKQKSEKRTCSSTTRVVKQSELSDDVIVAGNDTPKILKSSSNGMIPVNKSMSLVFSSNNIVGDKLLPSSVKRSTSLLDSIQKKPAKIEPKIRHKTDQLEDDIMQSLKEFDKFYESQKNEKSHSNKDLNMNKRTYIDTVKRGSRKKIEQNNKCDNIINGNHTPGGKISNDSAYSSLNRVSPSKLSLCNVKESNDTVLLEQPGGSDTSESHKEDRRSISSEEFLAMEKSTETEETLTRSDMHSSYNNVEHISVHEKRTSSRVSTHRTSHRNIKEALSSSGSETSLSRVRREQHSAPRLSRFCHECGSKFPDKAKFCIECGVKRLLV